MGKSIFKWGRAVIFTYYSCRCVPHVSRALVSGACIQCHIAEHQLSVDVCQQFAVVLTHPDEKCGQAPNWPSLYCKLIVDDTCNKQNICTFPGVICAGWCYDTAIIFLWQVVWCMRCCIVNAMAIWRPVELLDDGFSTVS